MSSLPYNYEYSVLANKRRPMMVSKNKVITIAMAVLCFFLFITPSIAYAASSGDGGNDNDKKKDKDKEVKSVPTDTQDGNKFVDAHGSDGSVHEPQIGVSKGRDKNGNVEPVLHAQNQHSSQPTVDNLTIKTCPFSNSACIPPQVNNDDSNSDSSSSSSSSSSTDSGSSSGSGIPFLAGPESTTTPTTTTTTTATTTAALPANFTAVDTPKFVVAQNSTHVFLSYGNETDMHAFYVPKNETQKQK